MSGPIVLYGNPQSGHSYKVRLMLVLAGMAHEYRVVDLAEPRSERPADFLAASRFGEVPSLLIDGLALSQSNAILQYLVERSGRFGGSDQGDELAVREWLCWEANRIGFSLPNLRYSLQWDPQPDDVLDYLRARVLADLNYLNQTLEGRDWLVGESASIADISACAYSYWSAQAGIEITRWPAVRRWLARIARLPGWQHPDQLMVSH